MRALLIPALGPVTEVEQDGLGDLRRLIEGHVEALSVCGRSDATVYVDEEGLLKGMPSNARAAQLAGAQIVGPAVICGFDAATGEDTTIPEDLAQAVPGMWTGER